MERSKNKAKSKIEPKKAESNAKKSHPLAGAYSHHVLLRPIENKQMSSIDLLQAGNLLRQERIKL
jgi:hypothetical protein